ncbi:trefoil factor 1 [Macrotis lagotis]|uniref:trefoil factor 1 n=1 Tax=Macrotis lagotis TaxID=92651 RepID=UPI003D683854
MEYKVFCTLIITLMLSVSVLTQEISETCNMEPKQRVNCGHPGITEHECRAKNCCFDDRILHFPWCFHPQAVPTEDECIF